LKCKYKQLLKAGGILSISGAWEVVTNLIQ